MMIKSKIKTIVRDAAEKCYPRPFEENPGPIDAQFKVSEPPPNIDADLDSNIGLILARFLKKSPEEVAERIAGEIRDERIKKIDIMKNGFLNIHLREDYLEGRVSDVCKRKESFFKPDSPPKEERVLIEFVSANPTGPLHIGHGRGAALGDSLARIYKQCGYDVQTEYYINDVGVQMEILADSVQARSRQIQGDSSVTFPENGYQGEYIGKIAQAMIERNRDNYDSYPKDMILEWIRNDLEDFGVHFNTWFGEASLYKNQRVEEVIEFLRSKDSLKEKDGAVWFKGQDQEARDGEMDKDRVLRKSDGRYTYFASDIAYHKSKFVRGYHTCIDIWGHDHHGYVARVQSAVAMLGIAKDSLKILLYQLVSLKRGGKKIAMSTRAGQFVTLKEILDEVGKDACRFFFAMRSPNSQLEFDVDLAKKQSNENPVFYVQYVHARICSIFREAEKRGIKIEESLETGFRDHLEKEEKELIKRIVFFTEVMEASINFSSPHMVAGHLLDTATKFHRFYDRHRVLDAEPKIRNSRIKILSATQIVVRLGLSLLGVSAPQKM